MNDLKLIDERIIFEKRFRIYGDFENPLFLAKDVAKWIDYDKDKVGQMLNTVDDEEKITLPIYYSGQVRNMWFLTEDGLYEVLMQSRKPAAKQWKKKVKEILKKIRKTGTYNKQLIPAQQLLAQAQMLVDMENRMNDMEQDIKRLEDNQRRTITSNQFTVIGYANMKGIRPNEYNSSVIGRKATKISKERNLQIGKVVDSKYGLINTYNEEVLDEIFINLD